MSSDINLFASIEKQIPMRVCHCGKSTPLFVKDDGKQLFRYPTCQEHSNAEEIKAQGYENPKFHPQMPPVFRYTDPAKLHPKVRETLDWMPTHEKSGLLLHGTTGVGKSRAAWSIVNRIWASGLGRNLNLPFLFLTMRGFEEMLEKSWDERNHANILKDISTTPLLVIDDLGKEKMTGRMAVDLFGIIDERSMNCRATIITTNFNSTALIDRFPPSDKETAIALVRRLKDYYKTCGIGVDN